MAFRKMKQKKYDGISEYYNAKSNDKTVISYYMSYRDINDKPIKKKSTATNPADAKKELEEIKYQIDHDKSNLSKKDLEMKRAVSLNRFVTDDIAELYYENRNTKNTIKDQQAYKNRVSPILGKIKVSKINDEDIKELRAFLKDDKKYSPKTINETFNSLRALFNMGMKKGWCSCNPINDIEREKEDETTEPGRVLSDDELKILFDSCKNGNEENNIIPRPNLFLFLKCLYFTGARPAGVIDIKVQDIDFNEKKIILKGMKKGKAYNQKVKDELLSYLLDWIKKHSLRYGDYIFYPQQTFNNTKDLAVKKRPATYPTFRQAGSVVFDRLFNQDIPIGDKRNRASFYSLRRTAGTKVYKAKGIVHAMRFLNHTNILTTQKYLNVSGDMEDISDVL